MIPGLLVGAIGAEDLGSWSELGNQDQGVHFSFSFPCKKPIGNHPHGKHEKYQGGNVSNFVHGHAMDLSRGSKELLACVH